MKEFETGLGLDRRDHEALRNLGEKALAEVVLGIKRADKTQAIAVITEDGPAGDAIRSVTDRELTVLSTRAFLAGLETRGFIPSAREILASAAKEGRNASRYNRTSPNGTARAIR